MRETGRRQDSLTIAPGAGELKLETRFSFSQPACVRRIESAFEVTYRHRILFSRDVFAAENSLLDEIFDEDRNRGAAKVLLTIDAGVLEAQPTIAEAISRFFARPRKSARLVTDPVILPGGEVAKQDRTQVDTVQALIERHGICRHSYVAAVGGGAHLDVVGFAAATAHRGIRHLRLPTTALAQADSGVGVKNGINAFGKKNFVGTFAPPWAVINDLAFLDGLTQRDKRCGYAEAVKVALIRDRAFFEEIEAESPRLASFHPAAMERVVMRCAELHVDHIVKNGDPFEAGSARPLDFGHWAAHKLETLSDYHLRHGEAVAIGIALDTLYSARSGLVSDADAERVLTLLERLGFRLFTPELEKTETDKTPVVLTGLDEFREHLGGDLTVTLLAELGRGIEVDEMDPRVITDALNELSARDALRSKTPSTLGC